MSPAQVAAELERLSWLLYACVGHGGVFAPTGNQWDEYRDGNAPTYRNLLNRLGYGDGYVGSKEKWCRMCKEYGFRIPDHALAYKVTVLQRQEPRHNKRYPADALVGEIALVPITKWNHRTKRYDIVGYRETIRLR